MYFGDMFIDYRLHRAVLECVAELGIDAAEIGVVARRVGRARSTLYLQHGGWRELLGQTHAYTLQEIDRIFAGEGSTRRGQFERWWARLIEFLRSPYGRGFVALRSRVSTGGPLETEEIARMPILVSWICDGEPPDAAAAARAQAIWLVALSAVGCVELEPELSGLAWSLVEAARVSKATRPSVDTAEDLSRAH